MKTTALILITAITATLTHSVMADNSENNLPPSGPYRSINGADQFNSSQDTRINPPIENEQDYLSLQSNKNMPNQSAPETPEWLKKQIEIDNWARQQNNRQQSEWVQQQQAAQRNQWLNQSNRPIQAWSHQPPMQWSQNQIPTAPNPNYVPNSQNNRMQQYFPAARGPVYGPGVPPPGFNNQPGRSEPQYRYSYPPVWR